MASSIRFVETSRIKCKFGYRTEHNTSAIAKFCGMAINFPTIPSDKKEGELKARIPTIRGAVLASVGDWIEKDSMGNLSVREGGNNE